MTLADYDAAQQRAIRIERQRLREADEHDPEPDPNRF